MKMTSLVLLVLLFGFGSSAFAACLRDGKTYQTGEKVGPFTCMADGQWRR